MGKSLTDMHSLQRPRTSYFRRRLGAQKQRAHLAPVTKIFFAILLLAVLAAVLALETGNENESEVPRIRVRRTGWIKVPRPRCTSYCACIRRSPHCGYGTDCRCGKQ
ncbi:uncharacterized protein [Dermacentor albipictus]|uniref:uncharacterized protein n=1 Tax=Dermacentor albipictus TaxID=60249 RepID=UPI0031FD4A46